MTSYGASTISGTADVFQSTNATNVPAGSAVGDGMLLIAGMWHASGDPVPTFPTNFVALPAFDTVQAVPSNGNVRIKSAIKPVKGSESGTYSLSYSVTNWNQVVCVLIKDCFQTTPMVDGGKVAGASSTAPATMNFDMAALGLVIHAMQTFNVTSQTTPPTGFTEIQDGDVLKVNYKLITAPANVAISGGVLNTTSPHADTMMGVKQQFAGAGILF